MHIKVFCFSLLLALGLIFTFFAPFAENNPASAQCASLPTDTGSMTTTVNIVSDGTYTVWSRMQAADETNDSYWIQVDDNCPIIVGDSGLTPNVWTWVNYQGGDSAKTITMDLTTGEHTVTLAGRDFGVKVDRILFSGNPTCIPTGIGDDCLAANTASINVSPSSQTAQVGTPFTVDVVVDGGGQAFNAAQATVTVSPDLSITNLTNPVSNGCNFNYTGTPPSASEPSFAGAILTDSSTQCTVYTMTLVPLSSGTGTITFSNASIKAYSDNSEILTSTQNGSYALAVAPTATSVPTNTPIPPTATPLPTSTPVPPTSTPVPTVAPTSAPTLTPPSVDAVQPRTYKASIVLSGLKKSTETILVNDAEAALVYPSATTWQVTRPLNVGENLFSIVTVDSAGNTSEARNVILRRHKLGDINGDANIDLADLSLFASDWQKTENLTNILSDNNEDGTVDLTDFSILAKQYGQ